MRCHYLHKPMSLARLHLDLFNYVSLVFVFRLFMNQKNHKKEIQPEGVLSAEYPPDRKEKPHSSRCNFQTPLMAI